MLTRAQIEIMFGIEKPGAVLSKWPFELPASIVQMILNHDREQRTALENAEKQAQRLAALLPGSSRRIVPGIPTRAFVAKVITLQFCGGSPAARAEKKTAVHYGKVEV